MDFHSPTNASATVRMVLYQKVSYRMVCCSKSSDCFPDGFPKRGLGGEPRVRWLTELEIENEGSKMNGLVFERAGIHGKTDVARQTTHSFSRTTTDLAESCASHAGGARGFDSTAPRHIAAGCDALPG